MSRITCPPSVCKPVCGILLIWLFSFLFMCVTYPPRHFVLQDYAVVIVIGMTACLVVPPPGVRWRYSAAILYALISGWPQVVFRVHARYGSTMKLQTMYGNETSSPMMVMVPLAGMLLLLMCAAVASTYVGAVVRRYLRDRGSPQAVNR